MQFRTELILPPSDFRITRKSKILTAGSCFAQVTGDKLQQHKFQVRTNPFGTIFNPLSLFRLLSSSLTNETLPEDSYIRNQDLWFNYHLHSSVKASSKQSLGGLILEKMEEVREFLLKADYLIITLGTAYIYELVSNGEPVANCHKMPQQLFNKRLLPPEEIFESWVLFRKKMLAVNPDIRFIISVSPVRHLKDTLPLNSVSKAILRHAAHQMTQVPEAEYFPAFEIVNDDLRDYRFYKEDMLHPTAQAEDYIWEKFSGCYFSEEIREQNHLLFNLMTALNHKPFSPDSASHKEFLQNTLKKLKSLQDSVDVSKEVEELQKRLHEH